MNYLIPLLALAVFISACTTQTVPAGTGDAAAGTCPVGTDDCLDDPSKYPPDGETPNTVTTMDVPNGYLARPTSEGDHPGVIMIHEWWGLNEHIEEQAKELAANGYIVYAIDLYDGEVAADADRARALSGSVRDNPEIAIAKMKDAVTYLEDMGVTRIGSLGWCFGGAQSLQLALNDKLDATVIYYGTLTNDTSQLSAIDSPVLGIFGADDTSIPVSSVESFGSALDSLGIENEIHIYPGVGHAFANPSGANFASDEAQDAWVKTLSFLDENLKGDPDAMIEQGIDRGLTDADTSEDTITIKVDARDFRFFVDGVESPELRVKEGQTVRIEFSSAQGFHDFVIDEFEAKTEQLSDGGTDTIEFVADRKGAFEYYCSVGEHRAMGMEGMFIVE